MSPTLFVMFTADIHQNFQHTHILTSADDTAIISISKNPTQLINYPLQIKPEKNQTIQFTKKRKQFIESITINNKKETVKYLGIRFDKILT